MLPAEVRERHHHYWGSADAKRGGAAKGLGTGASGPHDQTISS